MTVPLQCTKNVLNGQCCCTCQFLLADFSHPVTDGLSVLNQRGWICFAPEIDGAFSGWQEHGMCEMYQPKKDNGKSD
jgi:hypothetical protein